MRTEKSPELKPQGNVSAKYLRDFKRKQAEKKRAEKAKRGPSNKKRAKRSLQRAKKNLKKFLAEKHRTQDARAKHKEEGRRRLEALARKVEEAG